MLKFKTFIEEETIDEAYDPVKSKIRRLHNKFNNSLHTVTDKDVDYAMSTNDPELHKKALLHHASDSRHVDIGMKSSNAGVREYAVAHRLATPEHIARGLKDKDVSVRLAAISNPNATHEHAKTALHDPDDLVGHVATKQLFGNISDRQKRKPSFLHRIKRFISSKL